MAPDVRTINWLEVVAWCGLTVLLLALLGVALRNVWADKVRRIVSLETWRERHDAGETELKLLIRDLQNESRNHTGILMRLERGLHDVAALVGDHRRTRRTDLEEEGGL